MSWGDRVLLCIREKGSTLVFGYFIIEKISGLTPEAVAEAKKHFSVSKISDGGVEIDRGCGSYVAGATYCLEATIEEICGFLKGKNPGKLMVGGTFYDCQAVKLKDVPHRMGFREFDYRRFVEAVKVWKPGKKSKYPAVKGQFYASSEPGKSKETKGQIQEVREYRRKDETA